MPDLVIVILLNLGALLVGGAAYLLFNKRAAIAREARADHAPREWLFVNAYGPQQARSPGLLTFGDALSFLKEHVGCSFVRADKEKGIIFFDGRKLAGQ